MEQFIEELEDQCIIAPIRNEHSWFSLLLIKCLSVVVNNKYISIGCLIMLVLNFCYR